MEPELHDDEKELDISAFLRKHRFAGGQMSLLPADIEEDIRDLTCEQAVDLFNRVQTTGKRLCGVSDSVRVAQLLGKSKITVDAIKKEILMIKSSELKTAPTGELVKTYNELTGKSIKKFSSRASGEKQLAKLLPPDDESSPSPTEVPPTTTTEGIETMASLSKAAKSAKAKSSNGKAKAKSNGNGKTAAKRAARGPSTTKVQLTEGQGTGRLAATSTRTKIVEYIRKHYGRKVVEIEELSAKMSMNVRPFLAKLAGANWVKMT